MAKNIAVAPQESVLLYDKLVATNAHFDRKGAAVPYTSVNGNTFSYLSKSGEMALRLPAAERDAFLKKCKTRLCEAYGVVQPEYVMVPASLGKNSRAQAILQSELQICELTHAKRDCKEKSGKRLTKNLHLLAPAHSR